MLGADQVVTEYYPKKKEVDEWCSLILERAKERNLTARFLDVPTYSFQLGVRHTSGNSYLAFETPGKRTFYGYWQPASATPAPILFHLPGYGAEMSAHPELVEKGFNVLHINPQGYATPSGPSDNEGMWPVLPDTVKTNGKHGYVDWLEDALSAALWALSLDEVESKMFGCFGTSQGGGTSLLLASIMRDEGVKAAAADLPFLTNFPLMYGREDRGAYGAALDAMRTHEGDPEEWRALGFIDTMSHAHRLIVPTLLTAGGEDTSCPPPSIQALFNELPGTKSFTYISGQTHAYTVPFLRLASAWFSLYV